MILDQPPPGPSRPSWREDRDAEAVEAMEPYLAELTARFCAAGWIPEEIHYALLTWATLQTTYHAHEVQDAEVYNKLAELPGGIDELIKRATAAVYGELPPIQVTRAV